MDSAVTIGIAYHDPGAYFLTALRSILAQTLESWRLILIDDGSRDGSTELVRRIDDDRVSVRSDGHRLGLSARLNEITRATRTPFLARMDADDIMHPLRLQRQVAFLASAPAYTVVGTRAYSIDASSRIVGIRRRNLLSGGFDGRSPFIHPTVMARPEWFLSHPYSELARYRRAEDVELWCRSVRHSTFVNLDEALLYYREIGTASVGKYLRSALAMSCIVRDYFSARRAASWGYQLRIAGKAMLFTAGTLAGYSDMLVRRRSEPMDYGALRSASEALEIVNNTAIPGVAAAGSAALRDLRSR